MSAREKLRAQIELTILFSLFAIISNFTGIEIEHGKIISSNIYYHLNNETSLANTGINDWNVWFNWWSFVAIIVGIISGLSRILIGGANAYIYLFSSVIIALISGFYGYRTMRHNRYQLF